MTCFHVPGASWRLTRTLRDFSSFPTAVSSFNWTASEDSWTLFQIPPHVHWRGGGRGTEEVTADYSRRCGILGQLVRDSLDIIRDICRFCEMLVTRETVYLTASSGVRAGAAGDARDAGEFPEGILCSVWCGMGGGGGRGGGQMESGGASHQKMWNV